MAIDIYISNMVTFCMDYKWLQEQFEQFPGKNKAGLARALDMGMPAVSKMLNNTRQIKAREYIIMQRYFGLTGLTETAPQGLQDSNDHIDVDWDMPDGLGQPQPTRFRPYIIAKDTGSVRFCKGETLLLDPDRTLSDTEEPFVLRLDGNDMMGMCAVDDENMVHISPFGGRHNTISAARDDVEILGYIYSKMERV